MTSVSNVRWIGAHIVVACALLLTLGGCTSDTSPRCLTDDDCSGDAVCWTGTAEHTCVDNCTGSNGSEVCSTDAICTQPNALSEQQGCVPRSEYQFDAGQFDTRG